MQEMTSKFHCYGRPMLYLLTRERERERERMGVDDGPLFESKGAKGRVWYKVYAGSVFFGVCLIWVYRCTHIPKVDEDGRWIWMGLFGAELWFGLYWVLTQSVRWNPIYHHTFKERLYQNKRFRDGSSCGIDIFVCTVNPTIEPPTMVINTVLSVMAYNYPTEKLSVYLSDDGGSELTFFALLEASRFAKSWIPFCKKFKVEPRSPVAYFADSAVTNDVMKTAEWIRIKSLYKEMENRISEMMKIGKVPEKFRQQHNGFSEWNAETTAHDHQAILEILIDGRDQSVLDDEGLPLPTLVYMAREKRPHHHHNFKAGAMNSLLRVSSEISNGAVILNVDCDMYSNNAETVMDALCFFMDERRGHEIAYVQFPQKFINITKNDIYGNSLRMYSEVHFPGLDGYGGPLYTGSGCFHRRESLYGKKYNKEFKEELYSKGGRDLQATSILEERAKCLITCNYEDDTEWGKERGLKYGCPVEDVITGLSIQCNGWRSVYFNPSRMVFLGIAPVTLVETLIQQKRWSEGDFQIFLSKYCPLFYCHGRIKLGLQMGYTIYCLWAPCSFPTIYYAVIPSLTLLHDISLFPNISSLWILSFAYVIMSTTIYDLWESLSHGYTLKGWWNERRMWLYRRLASYTFAFIDSILKLVNVNQSTFIITSKVADEEVSKRYEEEIMDFGSPSPMFAILATVALLNLLCLIVGLKRLVLDEGATILGSFFLQFALCGSVVFINIPIYQAMFVRGDKGRMPISITLVAVSLAMLAYVI